MEDAAVQIGLVGVGNCASSLVQGLQHDGVRDVRVASAFDIADAKVGRELTEAIWAAPNNARRFADDLAPVGVVVADGSDPDSVAQELRRSGTTVVVSLLPPGAQDASERYATAALDAGCAYVNCMPAVLARSPAWGRRFADAGLPLVGDDPKSRFGATVVHRAVLDALSAGGVEVLSTYQLNVGGNEDFRALQDPSARAAKQGTKAAGIAAAHADAPSHVATEYVPHLGDRKTAFIRVEARGYGDTPIEIDVRMTVDDSPSAAPMILEAVRLAHVARAEGRGGVLAAASAATMKAPPAA